MELWIRSQDKAELINVDNLYLGQTDSTICTRYRQNQICIIILGYYTTKERALEVLDDIQIRIKLNVKNPNYYDIYEMPKD